METTIDSLNGFEFCKTTGRFVNVYIIYASNQHNLVVVSESPNKKDSYKLWNLIKKLNEV